MKDENASDLLGDSLELEELHECSGDTQEKRNVNSEDRERMSILVAQNSRLSIQKAKALVNRYF